MTRCARCEKQVKFFETYSLDDGKDYCEKCFNILTKKQLKKDSEKSKKIKVNSLKGVGGWLDVFVVILIIGIPLNIRIGLFYYTGFIKSSLPVYYKFLTALFIAFFTVILLSLIVYNLFSIIKHKPNAVAISKMTLFIFFLDHLLVLISSIIKDDFIETLYYSFLMFWTIVWYLYFIVSNRVRITFPYKDRKVYKRDWIVFISLITLYIFLGIFYLLS